jgi:predicted aspartyl protease
VSFPFNPSAGAVYVEASLSGPLGQADVRLILDTGATTTLIRSTILVAVGYDPDASPDRISVALGSGIQLVPRVVLNRLSALGQHLLGLPVLSHSVLPAAGADGLLGLDFLRGTTLTVDFRVGQIALT